MNSSNKPYKGSQAEQEERARLYPTSTGEPKDTVIEAGTNCIIIGLCTFFLGFGFFFFIAAFVLGIYAMATGRMRQGIILSIAALALKFMTLFVGYFLLASFLLTLYAALLRMVK